MTNIDKWIHVKDVKVNTSGLFSDYAMPCLWSILLGCDPWPICPIWRPVVQHKSLLFWIALVVTFFWTLQHRLSRLQNPLLPGALQMASWEHLQTCLPCPRYCLWICWLFFSEPHFISRSMELPSTSRPGTPSCPVKSHRGTLDQPWYPFEHLWSRIHLANPLIKSMCWKKQNTKQQPAGSRSLLTLSLKILLDALRKVICLHCQVEFAYVLLKLLGSEQHTEKQPRQPRWYQFTQFDAHPFQNSKKKVFPFLWL